MPATDALQPPLTPAQRAIVKSYGGWSAFMYSMGLKPFNQEDADEGESILTSMVEYDTETKEDGKN